MTLAHLAAVPWHADAATAAVVLEAAVVDNIRHLRRVAVTVDGPLLATVHVRLRWYAWLTCGVLHLRCWRRVWRLSDHVAPPSVRIRVRVL